MQQGGLAGAVASEDTPALPRVDAQIEVAANLNPSDADP
jgi:hypothetical protein